MKRYRICVDTNIWIDYIERKTKEANKSKQLLQLLTDINSPHRLIIPEVLYLEIMYKLIDIRKENKLISEGYSSSDIRYYDGKKLKFNTVLSKSEIEKIRNVLKDLKISEKNEIVSLDINFSKVEVLIKNGFELLDSMIIVQANSKVDYFVTRDTIVRKINDIKDDWIKLTAITPKGILSKVI